MYPQIKFAISMSYSIGDMLHTRFEYKWGQGHSDPKTVRYDKKHQGAFTHEIWDTYVK